MIIALTGVDGDSAVADLAEELAMLRVAAGKRVLLVSPNPCPYDAQLYDDLVVDASPHAAPKAAPTADTALTYHTRHSELALSVHKHDRKLCAPEVRHLYREIFRPAGRI